MRAHSAAHQVTGGSHEPEIPNQPDEEAMDWSPPPWAKPPLGKVSLIALITAIPRFGAQSLLTCRHDPRAGVRVRA